MRIAKSDNLRHPAVFTFNSKRTNLGVNSLGEVFRGDDCLVSSINTAELAQALGREPTSEDIAAKFQSLRADDLTAFEYGVAEAVAMLQVLNTGFARVWGGAMSRRMVINLTVEFILFDDDKEGWKLVKAWGKQHKGILSVMDKTTHLDKSKPVGAKRWKYGKDHGRPETQIEFIWNVTHMKKSEVDAFIKKLRETCDPLWSKYGMSVV